MSNRKPAAPGPGYRPLNLEFLEGRETPATLFVAPDGTDAGATSTHASPFRTLQYAANKAATSDTILVAAGTYTFDNAAYSNPTGVPGGAGSDTYTALGTDAVLIVKNKKLTVGGGFSRADNYAASNPAANPTVIDGQAAHRGVLVVGAGNAATGLEINGFTITRGTAAPATNLTAADAPNAFGGGALVDFTDPAARAVQLKVKFTNISFVDNRAAGGLPNSGTSKVNYAGSGTGGGLALKYAADVTLNNIIFRNNRAAGGDGGGSLRGGGAAGGALAAENSGVVAADVTFADNTAVAGDSTGAGQSPDGAAADAAGGAVSVGFGTATFTRVSATGNIAAGGDAAGVPGGGSGGAFYAVQNALTITQAIIGNNSAFSGSATAPTAPGVGATGAGVFADRSPLALTRVRVENNTAEAGDIPAGTPALAPPAAGAGVHAVVRRVGFANTAVTVTNSVVAGNRIVAGGGAAAGSDGGGAGLRFEHVQATVVHSTIANNTLDNIYGSGTAFQLRPAVNPTAVPATFGATVLNLSASIVAGNVGRADSAAVAVAAETAANFQQNLLSNPGSGTDIQSDPAAVVTGLGMNLPAADPQFADAAGGDFSLRTGSPAIDAGTASTTATDIGGGNRTGTPDLGAFEFGTAGSSPTVGTPSGADAPTGLPGVGGNAAPTISAVANVTVAAGSTTGPLPFTVGDAETPAEVLVVSAASDNITLVPPTGIALGGAAANRTVTVTPAAGRGGTALITLTVRDTAGATTSKTFTVTVPAPPALVGYPQFAAGGDAGSGSATLYNPDRSVRYSETPFAGFTGGVRTAAADFNGDGVADLVAGTGPGRATRVRVLDGVSKAELFAVDPFEATFTGGVYVAAGDLNGDGTPDLVITPDEGGGPRVDIYTGKGFGKFASFFGIDDPNFRGGARAAAGDLSGDGRTDLIVVAGFGGGPRVAGFDGKSIGGTPTRLFGDFFAFEQALRNGIFVAVGDIDADGYADLIAGGGPGGGPRVTVFGGKALLANTYDVKANFFGGDDGSRGGIRVAAKDLDGDNRADIVVGAGTGAGSRVTAYFGKDIGAAGSPVSAFDFDALPGSSGVYVG